MKQISILTLSSVIFFLLITGNIFAQNTGTANDPNSQEQDFCTIITDENSHIIIPKTGLVMLYFYHPIQQDSLIMKDILNQIQLEESISCYLVDISLSKGIQKTYRVLNTPSIVILQDKKIIYGTTGFTDDTEALTAILNVGIKNHLLISTVK